MQIDSRILLNQTKHSDLQTDRRNLDINAYSHTNCKCQKDVNMVLTLFELGCKEEKRRRGGERSEKCIVVLGLD